MTNTRRCPQCDRPTAGELQGLCPECLLKVGLGPSSAGASEHTVQYYSQSSTPAAVPLPVPSAGQEFGNYHLVRRLGKGGMGTVFEAEDCATGRRLALKVLSHSLDSPDARQRFLREGRLAASVNHPNSVYVFGTEEIRDTPVITMELIQGGTLQDQVRRQGPLPPAHAVDAILQVISGLEAAQAVGVLHRDVKPSNCFVDAEGAVKVGDFGLSISTFTRGEAHLTTSGVFLGTPAYASPEQLRGDPLDQRSDIYAVGVTLFYLLTGKVPFDADNMVKMVALVLEKPAPSPMAFRPELARGLASVVQQCLEKQPERRFRNYAELRQALVPHSSRIASPAPPGRRFFAGVLDGFLFALIFTWPHYLLGGMSWPISQSATPTLFDYLLHTAVMFASWTLYYILPEGLWGMSLGKRVCRLRVARPDQQPPGIGRSTLRSLIVHLLPITPTLIWGFANPGWQLESVGDAILVMAVVMSAYPILALLFITCRRHNGYAALQDLATNTRVLDRPVVASRPALALDILTPEEVVPGERTIGAYHVLERLGTSEVGTWYLGYDLRLLRKVWIHEVPEGTPPIPATLRGLSRPGRLRWLSGRRDAAASWDSYEALSGKPLPHLLNPPQTWDRVRFWLLDVAEELAAAVKDGTLPETLSLQRVWITAHGRAKLLDRPAPGLVETPAETVPVALNAVEPLRTFLSTLANAALTGKPSLATANGPPKLPLPLHARTILEGLTKVQRLEVFSAQLEPLLTKRTAVTRARRISILAMCLLFPLLASMMMTFRHVRSRWALAEQPELRDVRNYLTWHTPFPDVYRVTPEESHALEVLLAGRHRAILADPDTWTNPYMSGRIVPVQRKAAEKILLDYPAPPGADAEPRATEVAAKLSKTRGPFEPFEELPLFLLGLIVFGGGLLMYVALPSPITAVCFRGGLVWLLMGVTAVKHNGAPASRLRLLWRNLVAWSPIFLYPFVVAEWLPLSDDYVWPNAILVTVVAALTLWSLWLPRRGLPDRLAGTWLVLR